jgi:hypothetical protein
MRGARPHRQEAPQRTGQQFESSVDLAHQALSIPNQAITRPDMPTRSQPSASVFGSSKANSSPPYRAARSAGRRACSFHQAIQESHVEVMQLGRGKFSGALSHVGIGDFSLSIGSFSVGVRTQRVPTDDKLVIGMLLNAEDRVTHWSFDMRPADVLVMPPGTEHDGTFHGPHPMARSVLIWPKSPRYSRANRD